MHKPGPRSPAVLLMTILAAAVLGSGASNHTIKPAESKPIDEMATSMLAMQGTGMTSTEADTLEKGLRANPSDLRTRIRLLSYYFHARFGSESAKASLHRHVLWVIQRNPEAAVCGLPFVQLDPVLDKEAYPRAKGLWLGHIKAHPANAQILWNAAAFFLLHDRLEAESLLKKGQTLEPKNPRWPDQLGQLYSLGMNAKSVPEKKEAASKALVQLEAAYALIKEDYEKFYALDDLAMKAYEAGQADKAREYAADLLAKSASYKDDWNYGNAIQDGNIVLGRLALARGEVEKAKSYLIEAGKTPGSPQLNSFGPNMSLARELLEKGQKDVVLEYFQLCGKFWEMGKQELDEWAQKAKSGGIPDFGANLDY